MYLKRVMVKNFRSLKDVCVDLDENTVLIGENNVGKTTFLDAIRYSLTRINGKYAFDDYDYYMDESITSPKDSDGIEIILIFQERHIDEWDGYINDNFGEAIQFLNEDDDKSSIIIKVSSVYNDVTNEFETRACFLNREYEEIIGKIQKSLNSFYKLVPVFYLQALRDIRDVFSSKSPLWGKFLKKADIPKDKLEELQNSIETLNKDIVSNDINLTRLTDALEDIKKVLDFHGDDLVSINALPMKSWDLLSKAQLVLNSNSKVSFPLEKHGQGTQSVTTILLFKAYINILLEELNSKDAEAILTIEEPEAHLHPQAVRAVEKVIRELSCQKIITTHSPYFLQNTDLKEFRFFKKNHGITSVSKISECVRIPLSNINEGIRKISEKFSEVFELHEDKNELIIHQTLSDQLSKCLRGCCKEEKIEDYIEKTRYIFSEEELYNLNIYVQRTRGELLFARKWILYEGQTEDIIIQFCAELLGYNIEEYGVSGISYRSNGSAGAFIKLARVLGVDWMLLGDRDLQGTRTINEIKKCGYSDEEIERKAFLTKEKDIENEFIKNGFLCDYEKIVADEITDDIRELKEAGKDKEYVEKVVAIVQKWKVESAYKLVDEWKNRNMQKAEVPQFIKDFIEGVCKDDE